jgi:hypothetical protein
LQTQVNTLQTQNNTLQTQNNNLHQRVQTLEQERADQKIFNDNLIEQNSKLQR